MTDKEYYGLIQPYEDAMKLLLTRLEVLNHSIYETLHLFFTIRWLRKANPCFIMRYVEFCLFLGKFTMVNIIEYIEVNL